MTTMMQIQALQTLGNTSSNPTQQSNDSFQSMIQDMLGQYSKPQQFGDVFNMGATSGTEGSYFDLLRYTGDANLSSSMLGTIEASALKPLQYGFGMKTNPLMPTTSKTNFENIAGSTTFTGALAGANQYSNIIKKASATYGIPEKLIAAIIKQESNFNPSVVSHAGAQGLMQLMPGTARYIGVTNPFDNEQNIMGATKYISEMYNKHGKDLTLTLAAYNAGPGNVAKYGGVPPFKETQNYVRKVLGYYHA